MRDLDETDRTLLRLLLEDARRPYSELADRVDLSAPAVSDRIDRLQELGVIRRFTVDVDRSRLQDGVGVLVTLSVEPGAGPEVRAALSDLGDVEYVFRTADSRVVAAATIADADVERHLAPAFETDAVRDVEVVPLVESEWQPSIADATLGLECAECGNTVTSEGVSGEIGGERYEFCCPSCLSRFEERHEKLEEGI